MKDHSQDWAVAAGVGFALLSMALGSSAILWRLSMYWMLGSTAVAFSFGAAVRSLLDSPGMYPRSMRAIARAAEDRTQTPVYRRTAVAVYLYMAGMLFSAAAFFTILVVSFIFFRK